MPGSLVRLKEHLRPKLTPHSRESENPFRTVGRVAAEFEDIQSMDVQQLGEEYRSKTDKELLRLALNPDQLTSAAQVALTGELASRRIGGEAI